MKFRHLHLTSFQDAQENFEQIDAASLYAGIGAPAFRPAENRGFFFRLDTPTVANQRIYVWTGSAWTGIL